MLSVVLRVPGETEPGRGLRATRPLIAAEILDHLRCTEVRYIRIDEVLAIARKVSHAARESGCPAHSGARDHALIDGNKRTARLAMRVFLRVDDVSAGIAPSHVSAAGPFIEEAARDNIDVPAIAKRLSAWFPAS